MKIKLIKIKDYKKVKNFSFHPGDHSLVLIAGKNKTGKSSVMGAMTSAIGGGKFSPEEPIRRGAKSADIKIEYEGDLLVHRRFLPSGSTSLEIKNKVGTLNKPQQILDNLVGSKFLNPLGFMRLSGRKQRDAFVECVDIDLDLEAHDKERKAAFDERTDANRDIKRFRTELEANPAPDEGDFPDEKSPTELMAKLKELTDKDSMKSQQLMRLDAMRSEAKRLKSILEELKASVKIAEGEYEKFLTEGKSLGESCKGLEEVESYN